METKAAKRVKTPTVLQMEAVECGAASLAIVLHSFGKFIPLEELRIACGVSRDGSKASNILKAARQYGLICKGYRKEPSQLKSMQGPMIVHWNFNHFLVLEGFRRGKVYLNDPASGPRVVSEEEFDQSFTGVVLTFEPGPDFTKSGHKSSMGRALASRLAGNRIALTYVILVGLLLILPGLALPAFTKVFVDEVLLGSMNHWLFPLLIGLALTAAVRAFLQWLQQLYLLRLETKIALTTSSQFLWHVLRLPMNFFTQRFGGEIGARVLINDRVAMLLSGELATSAISAVMVVFYLTVMLQYSVLLTVIGILIGLMNFVFLRLISRRRKDQNQRLASDRGKLQGVSMSGLQIIETLKASGGETDYFAKWAGHQTKLMNAEQSFGVSSSYLTAFPTFLHTMNTVVILSTGGLMVMNGQMTIGMLVAFQSLMASFSEPVNRLVQLGGQLQEMEADMNRLDDVYKYPIDARLKEQDPDAPAERTDKVKLQGFVELRDVSFGYSVLDPPLIENFNLQLKPGMRVALVGGSGSGKSTVARLVSGLYEPWSGEILFDGRPRGAIPKEIINHSLAAVDQDIHLFEGTIRDNLTMWDRTVPEADIVQAARDACIYDEIMIRPGGLDHRLTEGGGNFSGGQRQRLEIARALVNNPSILVLDEATSALDARTEQEVDDHIRRRGATCLIIAHRLSTIRDADEIIVLDKGKIVQRGTHDELANMDGPYAELIKAY